MYDALSTAMMLAAISGFIGGLAYIWECAQGRIGMWTTWGELNTFQTSAAFMALGGVAVFILALIARVIFGS
jgi:hypothetical protein